MQNPAPPSLPTLAYVLFALASLVVAPITALITYVATRRKQRSDIAQSDAQTRKTDAETRQIDSQVVLKAYERLDALEGIVREQNMRISAYQQTEAKLRWVISLAEQREKVLNQQIDQANAELKLLRIKPFKEEP